jgi:dihydroxy-acid dehydratase
MTRKAFENAIVLMYALGGSTNGVLHLLALAREADVPLDVTDFNIIGRDVPLIGNLMPSGRYNMLDVYNVGGTAMVLKELAKHGLLNTDCITVNGKVCSKHCTREILVVALLSEVVRSLCCKVSCSR